MSSTMDIEYLNINQTVDNIYMYNATFVENVAGKLYYEILSILCLIILSAGAVINLLLTVVLWRTKIRGNGVLVYILQLCTLDGIGTSCSGLVELYTFHQNSWTLGTLACRTYLYAESFTGAAIAYTLLSLDLHVLTITNLQLRDHHEYQDDDDSESECTSQHSLVSIQSGKPRIMTMDYRRNSSSPEYHRPAYSLSSTLPTILVWCLSASLSVPALILPNITDDLRDHHPKSCSMFLVNFDDNLTSLMLALLLGIFRVVIPLLFLIFAAISLIIKLSMRDKQSYGSGKSQLILAIVLTISYILMSMHRPLLMVLHGFTPMYTNFPNGYMNWILVKNSLLDATPSLTLSTIHYLLLLLRPIFYYCTCAEFKKALHKLCKFHLPNEL